MRAYIDIEEDLRVLLNGEFRKKDIPNEKEQFLKLIGEINHYIGISTKFLINLMDNKDFDLRQRTHRLNKLIKGIFKHKVSRTFKDTEFVKYHTDVLEYGYDKKGRVCLLSEPKNIGVGKEFICRQSETLNFIDVERDNKPLKISLSKKKKNTPLPPLTFMDGFYYNQYGNKASLNYIKRVTPNSTALY